LYAKGAPPPQTVGWLEDWLAMEPLLWGEGRRKRAVGDEKGNVRKENGGNRYEILI